LGLVILAGRFRLVGDVVADDGEPGFVIWLAIRGAPVRMFSETMARRTSGPSRTCGLFSLNSQPRTSTVPPIASME
jgi:hypothetical protein